MLFTSCSAGSDTLMHSEDSPSPTPYLVEPEEIPIALAPLDGEIELGTDSTLVADFISSLRNEIEAATNYYINVNLVSDTDSLMSEQNDILLLGANHEVFVQEFVTGGTNVFLESYMIAGTQTSLHSQDILGSLQEIYDNGLSFTSSSFNETTFHVEQQLWAQLDLSPYDERWYSYSDSYLKFAETNGDYVISSVYDYHFSQSALMPIVTDDRWASLPYQLTKLSTDDVTALAYEMLVQWFYSTEASILIKNYRHLDCSHTIFYPIF